MSAQEHRERTRPDAVRVVLPEQVTLAGRFIEEQVGIDDSAAHSRLRRVVAEAGGVDRLAGNQGRAIVDPRPKRRGRPCKPDGERVVDLPGSEHRPVFTARARHLWRPEVRRIAALGGPIGLVPGGEDEALGLPALQVGRKQDRESVGGIVGGRDQPPALLGLENRRIAVADQDLGMDVLGQQWAPRKRRRRPLARAAVNVRHERAEVLRELAEKSVEILLGGRGDEIAVRPAIRTDVDAEAVAFRARSDCELHDGGA